MEKWVQTGKEQWVKKIERSNYLVVEISLYEGDYYVHELLVNLDEWKEEDLRVLITRYYESSGERTEAYEKNWKQMLAGIIAGNEVGGSEDESFGSLTETFLYLEKQYEIIAA